MSKKIELNKLTLNIVLRKTKTLFFLIFKKLITVLFIPIILIIYFLRIFILVRFQVIPSSRIGHFVINSELYLAHNKNQTLRNIDFFCFEDFISNKFYANHLEKKLNIFPKFVIKNLIILNKLFSKVFLKLKNHEIIFGKTLDNRDVHNIFDKTAPSINFTEEEKKLGWNILNNFGIKQDSKYICLYVRDSKYLKTIEKNKDYSRHDFRNDLVENYLKAAEFFTTKGYYVIRIGSIVEQPLITKNKMIIDYPLTIYQSDFMDFFICANCQFAFGNTSGALDLCNVFRKPIGVVHVPIFEFQTWSEKIFIITKKHYSLNLKRFLKLSEIFQLPLQELIRTEGYEKNNIKLVNLTSDEIKDFAIETTEHFEKNINDTKKNQNQLKFKKLYVNLINESSMKNLHGDFKATMSHNFLEKNVEFLE